MKKTITLSDEANRMLKKIKKIIGEKNESRIIEGLIRADFQRRELELS